MAKPKSAMKYRGATESKAAVPSDDLHAMLDRQSADGWFGWNNSVAKKLMPRWKELESRVDVEIAKLTSQQVAEKGRVIHTVLVLLLLREKFADRESSWKRAADKARRWICSVAGVDAAALQRWFEAEMFREFLKNP
jgi:hypothetical protein